MSRPPADDTGFLKCCRMTDRKAIGIRVLRVDTILLALTGKSLTGALFLAPLGHF